MCFRSSPRLWTSVLKNPRSGLFASSAAIMVGGLGGLASICECLGGPRRKQLQQQTTDNDPGTGHARDCSAGSLITEGDDRIDMGRPQSRRQSRQDRGQSQHGDRQAAVKTAVILNSRTESQPEQRRRQFISSPIAVVNNVFGNDHAALLVRVRRAPCDADLACPLNDGVPYNASSLITAAQQRDATEERR